MIVLHSKQETLKLQENDVNIVTYDTCRKNVTQRKKKKINL